MSELVIGNGITIKIRKSGRARQMRIAVHRDGTVRATRPTRMGLRNFLFFLEHHLPWIQEKVNYFSTLPQVVHAVRHSKTEKLRLHAQAKELAEHRLKYFNHAYGFAYNRISIRDQKTRWGSCSRSGNLNFNYRIALLPPHLADYVIVHELCHLDELNHSKNFWTLMARVIPNPKELRRSPHFEIKLY